MQNTKAMLALPTDARNDEMPHLHTVAQMDEIVLSIPAWSRLAEQATSWHLASCACET
jgi:hypothetical protein